MVNKNYLYKTLFVIAIFSLGFLAPRIFGFQDQAMATNYTVCDSGCDYPSISDAQSHIGVGNTLEIRNPYITGNVTDFPGTPINILSNLNCQNSGAVIGFASSTQLNMYAQTAGLTIQNCNFYNIKISTSGANDNLQVLNNIFQATSTLNFSSNVVVGPIISNNTGLMGIDFNTMTTGTISNNTFNVSVKDLSSFSALSIDASSNVYFGYNTVVVSTSTSAVKTFPGSVSQSNITITHNSFSYGISQLDGLIASQAFVSLADVVNADISYNYFDSTSIISTPHASQVYLSQNSSATPTSATVSNNTFYGISESVSANSFLMEITNTTAVNVSVTSNYNLFYNTKTNTEGFGINITNATPGFATVSVTSDYDGFWNFNTNAAYGIRNTSATVTEGGHSKYGIDPFLMLNDVDTTNNLHPAPWSSYFDVNGSLDIGATSAARRSTINFAQSGTINYSTVDATSTLVNSTIASNLRSNDTLNFAAGTYWPLNLATTTAATTGITITGAGSNTIFYATSTADNAILFNGFSNSTIENLAVQNASSSVSSYFMTKIVYDYDAGAGVNTYNRADLAGGALGDALIIGAACSVSYVNVDNFNITSAVGSATSDWNLGLLDFGGAKITGFVLNSVAANGPTLAALCGTTVDKFINSVFTVSGGTYTYDSAAVAAQSVNLTAGYTNPPRIDRTQTFLSGIKLLNANSNTIQNVTSTLNAYDFYFSGTSANNVVSSSAALSSVLYDLYSDVSSISTNNVKNTSFDSSKVAVINYGTIDSYSRVRAFITNYSSVPINNISVEAQDNAASPVQTIISGSNGYSPYTPMMLAYVMTSSSATNVLNGGYNPFTLTALSSSGYAASSTSRSLGNTKDLTVSIAMDVTTDPDIALVAADKAALVANDIKGANTDLDHVIVALTNPLPSSGSNGSTISWGSSAPGVVSNDGQTVNRPAAGAGNATVTMTATISKGIQSDTKAFVLTVLEVAPTAPTLPVVTPSTTSSLFSWTDNSSSETGFIVDKTTDGTTYTNVSTTAANIVSYNVTGLIPNTQYGFRVAATNTNGTSSYATSTPTYNNAAIPGTPTAAATGQTTETVSWDANSNPSGTVYELYNVSTSAVFTTTTDVSINVTGLTAGTPYVFKVRAQYKQDNLTWSSYSSNSTSVSTTAAPVVSSGGGGGGGSGSPAAPAAPVTVVSPILSQTFSIVGSTVVMIGNVSHLVQINSVNFDTNEVIFTIQSTSITFSLKVGEEKLLDTNADSVYDLYVKLNSISQLYKTVDLKMVSVADMEFTINRYLSITNNREVILYFNSPTAIQMAISNSADFSNISYEPYQSTKKWTLTAGDGYKTVYTKFRTLQGGDKIVLAEINLVEAAVDVPVTPVIPPSFVFTRNLSYGMTGSDVKKLQEILKAQGFFVYPTLTTYFGSVTREAVRKYQQANNIATFNGVVGPDTRAVLNQSVKIGATPIPPSFVFTRNLSYGMTGSDVKKLQEILKAQGFFVYPTLTTYFGSVTREAVRKYQQANNIATFNGVVGPDTRAALNK